MATCTCGKRKSKYAISCNTCHQEMLAAAASERMAFNAAVAGRAQKPVLETAFGPYEVLSVDRNWDYRCRRAGATGAADRTFCGCNDGAWARLMEQAGVAREERWEGEGVLDGRETGPG